MSEQASRVRANELLLDAFEALWRTVPDQRFGQLVMNLSRAPGGFADTWEWSNARWHEEIQRAYDSWGAA
jgi:hypothetical protein